MEARSSGWAGTSTEDLIHFHKGRSDAFTSLHGLSSISVESFYEDREGNIWVATTEGLDRFRDVAVPRFSDPQGLSSGPVTSVLAATDGSMWLGSFDGLNRWKDGQVTI